jgi:hypothetical protein
VSFLIDPPWLYATGRLYGRAMQRESRAAKAVEAATVGAFLATSVSLYLDLSWTKPIWRTCRAASGRDWMLNSGVLKLDSRRAGLRTHLLSAAIFATYPLWLRLGLRRGRRMMRRGRRIPLPGGTSTG